MSTPTHGLTHNASKTIAHYPANSGARAVKPFRDGANQEVRIPKEFELPGTDAVMHREGNRLILELVPDKPKKGTPAAPQLALDKIAKLGPCEDDFAYVGEEVVLPLNDIDLVED